MTALSLTFLAFAVCAPLVVGLVSMMTQIHVARDRKSRTGKGWDARDTFEVKDAALGAAVMMFPIAAAFAFVDAKLELPSWQWWSVLLAIGVISAPFSMRSIQICMQFAAFTAFFFVNDSYFKRNASPAKVGNGK